MVEMKGTQPSKTSTDISFRGKGNREKHVGLVDGGCEQKSGSKEPCLDQAMEWLSTEGGQLSILLRCQR